jgi:hypothetical protein
MVSSLLMICRLSFSVIRKAATCYGIWLGLVALATRFVSFGTAENFASRLLKTPASLTFGGLMEYYLRDYLCFLKIVIKYLTKLIY